MYIVFDIGGTTMRVATAEGGILHEITKVPTPKDPSEAVATLAELGKKAAGGAVSAVVGDVPGVVHNGVVYHLPNLPTWDGLQISELLSKEFNAPAHIMNDVAVVGLGEAHHGAGDGSRILAYVSISTGMNGVRIVDGVIDEATYGFEIGWQLINGIPVGNQVSGSAVQRKFGISPKDLESIEERNKLADILADGLYNTVLHWSPDTIVLGGSMIVGTNPIPLERVETSLRERVLKIYPASPKITMATLGDTGGLYGAMTLAEKL